MTFYRHLGYRSESLCLVKPLDEPVGGTSAAGELAVRPRQSSVFSGASSTLARPPRPLLLDRSSDPPVNGKSVELVGFRAVCDAVLERSKLVDIVQGSDVEATPGFRNPLESSTPAGDSGRGGVVECSQPTISTCRRADS